MNVRRVLFGDFAAPNAAFHASLRTIPSEGLPAIALHRHDFFEWMVILDGEAHHLVNGVKLRLTGGRLVLMRPDDVHAVETDTGGSVRYVNIAFPSTVWRDFALACGIVEEARAWEAAVMPAAANLPQALRQIVENEALRAVGAYRSSATRLAFCQFSTSAAQALLGAGVDNTAALPLWLSNMLDDALRTELSELSVETLTEASGVSFGHLCHTMKKLLGTTPTQYINRIKIERASHELAATDKDIACIAFDCGFQNLSYFYRRFHHAHNKSPNQYRLEARRALLT